MSMDVKVPAVGESITEVTISQWIKKEGDYVEMDDVLCELESDKATFELNAEDSGVLHIKIEEGETIEIGEVIAEIDTKASGNGKAATKETKVDEEEHSKPAAENEGELEKTGEMVEMKIPAVGESISEVTISSWIKKEGDFVSLDEVIAEIESDKATFELTAEAQGILHIEVEEGETVDVGALICKVEVTKGKPAAAPESKKESAQPQKGPGTEKSYAANHASPAAAKILAEKGIDPKEVNGTGVDGRITREDAMKAEKAKPREQSQPETKAQSDSKPATSTSGRPQTRKKMSNLRKTVARRLVAVKNEMAMLTTFNEVDMKPVMDLRKKYKDKFKEKYEVNLGFMSFFTKAASQALKEFPAVNAMIDGDEMVYNEYIDVSIAVSTPRGLVVPVIRDADKLGFDQIEKEIINLATKARDNKLSIEEMTGGTFTITNGGVFGSMLSTPIINAPQSAILGMHNIVERPVAMNGEVVIRPVMYVALSYDHRIIDGRESVSFLFRIKELIEDPARLMLGI